jgi:hypothetical protein
MSRKRWGLTCGVCGLACAVVGAEVRHLVADPSDHAATWQSSALSRSTRRAIDHTHADVEGFVALELPGDIAAITSSAGNRSVPSSPIRTGGSFSSELSRPCDSPSGHNGAPPHPL